MNISKFLTPFFSNLSSCKKRLILIAVAALVATIMAVASAYMQANPFETFLAGIFASLLIISAIISQFNCEISTKS